MLVSAFLKSSSSLPYATWRTNENQSFYLRCLYSTYSGVAVGDVLKHLDLFSGIGGFALAARNVGWETVGFCEIDPYCQQVLSKHWPDVPIYEDVRDVTAERLRADGIDAEIITGGFPCQDISHAGKQAGIKGNRSGLWSELIRIVGEFQPKRAVFENVTALLSGDNGGWFQQVLWDISQIGYDAEWHCIPASWVGARQLRDRVFIVANPKRDSIQGRRQAIAEAWIKKSRAQQLAGLVQPCAWPTVSESRNRGAGDGIPNRIHRNKALGNAIVPQVAQVIFEAINEVKQWT